MIKSGLGLFPGKQERIKQHIYCRGYIPLSPLSVCFCHCPGKKNSQPALTVLYHFKLYSYSGWKKSNGFFAFVPLIFCSDFFSLVGMFFLPPLFSFSYGSSFLPQLPFHTSKHILPMDVHKYILHCQSLLILWLLVWPVQTVLITYN